MYDRGYDELQWTRGGYTYIVNLTFVDEKKRETDTSGSDDLETC